MEIELEKRRVAVRTLVETVMLSGNLSPMASSARLLDGIRGHQALQAVAVSGAQNEVSVSGVVASEHIELTVYGRIDRLYGSERVEEIKTTYLESERLNGGDAQHWAQAKCYAYLYCVASELEALEVSVTYFQLDTGEITTFTQAYTKAALEEFYRLLTGRYLGLLETEYRHEFALREDVRQMAFPYPSFREGQHELASQVYYAIYKKSALLAQAPTGTGKTMAVLFPALKALADGHASKIFYLTARTTQQQAAVNAARLIHAPHLRAVVITAKEKICVHDQPICREGDCPRAAGYYDRLGEALAALEHTDGLFTPDVIRAHAARHFLCPFEFSLDLSLTCDLIICDYNYAFDPRVRLQRFFTANRNGYVLLVDEAHNLPDRARSMYSASISLSSIVETRKSVPKQHRKAPLYRALKRLEAALSACFDEIDPPFAAVEPPESLTRPLEAALDQLLAETIPADPSLARQLGFDLSTFRFVLDLYDPRYRTLLQGGKNRAHRYALLHRPGAPACRGIQKMPQRGAVLRDALALRVLSRPDGGQGGDAVLLAPLSVPAGAPRGLPSRAGYALRRAGAYALRRGRGDHGVCPGAGARQLPRLCAESQLSGSALRPTAGGAAGGYLAGAVAQDGRRGADGVSGSISAG